MKQVNTARTVLDAATLLFSELGYEGASVAEIAKLAGVASGTVIYQYKNKENLLQVIAWEFFNNLLQRLRQAKNGEKGRPALVAFIKAFFAFVDENQAQSRVMLRHHMIFQKELQRFPLAADGFRALKVSIQELREILEPLAEQGADSGQTVEHILGGILANLLGACWLAVSTGTSLPDLEHETLGSILLRLEAVRLDN